MNRILILAFAILISSLTACATSRKNYYDDESGDNPNVTFTLIAQGQYSNISLANQLVIKNETDWLRLLKINGDTNVLAAQKAKSPAIDFDDTIVIAVFAGQQPSGGYSISITNIKRVGDNLFVTLKFNEPDKDTNVSLALTQPYIMVSTDAVDGKIIFLGSPK